MSMSMPIGPEGGSVRATYDAAAEYFDEGPLSFRDRIGRRTIARLELPAGADVLDVGCGTGATAILAAELVGREGRVIGVDLSARTVTRARAKARARGVRNASFVVADMGELALAGGSVDAVISAFSIFFAPDMEAQVRKLWRLVRPGGQLAITTWGPRSFEPALSAWRWAVEQVSPGTVPVRLPWDRLAEVPAVRGLLSAAGIPDAEVVAEEGHQALRSPEDWWTIVLGTGARRLIDRMPAHQAARVKDANLDWFCENGIDAIETNVIYAVATKRPDGRSMP
jgi:ubiquinone/menaquinone biosynthesis C-methylase UbiE